MADREKVMKGLEYHMKELGIGKTCFGCPYFGDNPCEIELIENALELLKEQEPVKPKAWVPKGQTMAMVRGYYCPVCDTSVVRGDRFCHWCGVAVKWDD